jgi:hypothetical protein
MDLAAGAAVNIAIRPDAHSQPRRKSSIGL